MSFEALGLPSRMLRVLSDESYNQPTPIQAAAIPALLSGRDLLGSAQTGTGKTAAFCLPLIVRLSASATKQANPSPDANATTSPSTAVSSRSDRGKRYPNRRGPAAHQRQVESRPVRALIVAPTRELAIQIQDSLNTYGRGSGLRNTVIVGGVSQFHQERALRHGVDVVVATPGRLVDLMSQGLVDLTRVEVFVLDEADRMFDLGFLPDMKRIVAALPKDRQNAMFSATMPAPLEELAIAMLRDPVRVSIAPVEATTNLIDQSLCYVPQSEKTKLLMKLLPRANDSRCIVFARTKHGADRIAEQLSRAKIDAEALHGNKSQNARQRILARFKSPRPQVLVATDLAARGIDIDGVSHVFNFDLPNEPETYIHRIGRTGRAGATGQAISFCSPAEMKFLVAIERLVENPIAVDEMNSMGRPAMASPEKRERRKKFRPSGQRGGYVPRSQSSSRSSGENRGGEHRSGELRSSENRSGEPRTGGRPGLRSSRGVSTVKSSRTAVRRQRRKPSA